MQDEATILLVDDNGDDVLLMKRALKKAEIGNPVQAVNDGSEAMDYLAGRGRYSDRTRYPFPILVLLDLKMPLVSGLEFLTWWRQQSTMRRLWVVVLTHSQELADINRAYDLGAKSYLVKPSKFSGLIELARMLKEYWLSLPEKADCDPKS